MVFLGLSNQAGGNRQKLFDYHKKKLENPFYSRKKRIINFGGLKAKITIAAIIILAGAFVWLIYFSGVFKIKNVEISGLNKISREEINALVRGQMEKSRFRLDPQDNLLFFNSKKIIESFQENYRFHEIAIKKKWLNSLNLEIKEKILAAAWLENEKYYYLDSEGYVLAEADPLEIDGRKYPVIKNESNSRISEGKIGLENSFIPYAAELLKKTLEKMPELDVSLLSVNGEIDSLNLLPANGPKIIFNTKDSIDKQLERLLIIKEEKMKDDFAAKKYIDLRFGDKIYYQ
jgi:hypothetical protein